jgi:hypothetical protein
MKRILVLASLALIAAACSSSPQTVSSPDPHARVPVPNPGSSYDVTGLLEVTVNGFEKNSSAGTASAKFYGIDKSGKLSAKGLLVPNSNVAFTPQFVSSFDTFSGATTTRYVEAGFNITNNSPTTYYNMTMVASSLAAATTSSGVITTVGGTALSDILNGVGAPIPDVAVARSMVPVHGFTAGFTYAPNVNMADLHFLTAAEAASVKAQGQASGQIPAININKVLPLEYGFVARNAVGTGRTISPSTCTTLNCNKGKVTFAYSFPLDANIAKQPYSYKVWYVVANEFIATWSQMLNDDVIGGVRTVAGVPYANPLISTHRSRVLENGGADKRFIPASGTDLLENLCAVKTANAVGADPVFKHPAVSSSAIGALDGCYGENGVRGRRFSNTEDFNPGASISVDKAYREIVIAGTLGSHPNFFSADDDQKFGKKLAISKFDQTGKQLWSTVLPLTSFPSGFFVAADFVMVKRVISSAITNQIVVFGMVQRCENSLGCTDIVLDGLVPFVLRFTRSGVLTGYSYLTAQPTTQIGFLALPTGDLFVDQNAPANPDIYVAYSSDYSEPPSRDWILTKLNGSPTSVLTSLPPVGAFGSAGSYTRTMNDNSGGNNYDDVTISGLVVINGKSIIVGQNSAASILTTAVTAAGIADTSWDGDGLAVYPTTQTGLAGQSRVTSAKSVVPSDGTIIIAGHTKIVGTSRRDYFALKVDALGALGTGFGTGGKTIVDCATNGSSNLNPQIAMRSNGEIFLIGQSGPATSTGHCVSRLGSTGSVLSSQNYDLVPGVAEIPASDAHFTDSGRLVVGGTAGANAVTGLIKW